MSTRPHPTRTRTVEERIGLKTEHHPLRNVNINTNSFHTYIRIFNTVLMHFSLLLSQCNESCTCIYMYYDFDHNILKMSANLDLLIKASAADKKILVYLLVILELPKSLDQTLMALVLKEVLHSAPPFPVSVSYFLPIVLEPFEKLCCVLSI